MGAIFRPSARTRKCCLLNVRASPVYSARADGAHEYECTKCGYTMFPAAGRESKFFGADFKCPQPGCGAGKDEFVDNGLA